MNIYEPVEPPPARPLRWDPEDRYSVPISRSIWSDYEIRRSMEHALSRSSDEVRVITKQLVGVGLRAMHTVTVRHPYELPGLDYTPGAMSADREADNQALKGFAFDAYDRLRAHFGDARWHDWFVAPFFAEGDDTHDTVNLGVFIGARLLDEVVE